MRQPRTPKAKVMTSNLEKRTWDNSQPQVTDLELDTTAASHETEEVDRFYQKFITEAEKPKPAPPALRKCGNCKTTLVVDPKAKPGTEIICFKCGQPHVTDQKVILIMKTGLPSQQQAAPFI